MKYILLLTTILLLRPSSTRAFSVLTHEAIIDVAWEPVIVPLLKQKYPSITAKQLEDAHAYAYGGAIAPDMGYFPFGNRLFSDLLHYVRTGDFIKALEDGASNINEYAFAMGALAHYNADRYGHPLGVNLSVPIIFPEARAEHGPVVTYEEDPIKHIRTEFGFDVLQTARGNYASDAYHRFISFEIADSLLKRAFKRNYDLDIDSLFKNFPRSVRTFRWAVKDIFPQLTKSAWKAKRSEIKLHQESATARSFHYKMRRASFYSAYGREIEHPRVGARLIAGIMRMLPKVGPLKALKVVVPGPEAEKLFVRSFDTVSAHYARALRQLSSKSPLQDVNFDTGHPSEPGEYKLADKTYYTLLMKLKDGHFAQLSPDLKNHLLQYYRKENAGKLTASDAKEKFEIREALQGLKLADTTLN